MDITEPNDKELLKFSITRYCETFKIKEEELKTKLEINSYEDFPRWAALLMNYSEEFCEDMFSKFIQSRHYKKNHLDKAYKIKELLYNREQHNAKDAIPQDLKDFFLENYQHSICPDCGSLLIYREFEDEDIETGFRVHWVRNECLNCYYVDAENPLDTLNESQTNEHGLTAEVNQLMDELDKYQDVMQPTGFSVYPFKDCDYSDTSIEEEINYHRKAMNELGDYLNVHYLNNAYIINAEQSDEILDWQSSLITDIFHNTTSVIGFNINDLTDCQFRILNSNILDDIKQDDLFDTTTITKLLQVLENNSIIGYILIYQQFPLEQTFKMNKVTPESSKITIELCNLYNKKYGYKELDNSFRFFSDTENPFDPSNESQMDLYGPFELELEGFEDFGEKNGFESSNESQMYVYGPFEDIENTSNPFDSVIPRCKKCGKVFCLCNFKGFGRE